MAPANLLPIGDNDVIKHYLYQATMTEGFVSPIIILFLVENGISYTEVGILGAIFMGSWVVSEIPTGYVGDRLGRRNSLVLGSLLTILALSGFAFGETFPIFAFAYVVWPVGLAFRSGTESAWLYDVLSEDLDEDRFTAVKGRGEAIWYVGTAITSLFSGYLAGLNWVYPFVANVAILVVSIAVLYTFPEPDVTDDNTDDRFTLREARAALHVLFSSASLRSFVVYTALFFGFWNLTSTFTQPVSRSVGVSLTQFGWLYAGFYVVSAVASNAAGLIREYVGIRRWFLGLPFIVALFFLPVLVQPIIVLPAIFLLRMANSVTTPLQHQYLNDRIESVGRATSLSAVSMVSAIAGIGFRSVGGIVADRTSALIMLVAASVTLAVGAGLVAWWQLPLEHADERVV